MTNYHIDTEKELLNLVDYIKKTWILPQTFSEQDLISFVRAPFEGGLVGGQDWCKNVTLSLTIHDHLYDPRNEYLEANHDDFSFNDGYYHMIRCISDGYRKLERAALENWSYEKFCRPFIKNARKVLNGESLSPKPYGYCTGLNYDDLREKFEDHDDLGYWDKDDNGLTQADKEKTLFKGQLIQQAGSFDFIGRTTLHYVLQSDVNQGRDPIHELVAAIITHGLNVAEFNNTAGAIEFVKTIQMPNEFQYTIPELPDNRFLKACYHVGNITDRFEPRTPELEQKVAQRKAEIAALTPEQLAERRLKNKERMRQMTNEILDEIKKEEASGKRKEQDPFLSDVYSELGL